MWHIVSSIAVITISNGRESVFIFPTGTHRARGWTVIIVEPSRTHEVTQATRTGCGRENIVFIIYASDTHAVVNIVIKIRLRPSARCTRCVHRRAARRDERDEHSARERARPARARHAPRAPHICGGCQTRAFGVFYSFSSSACALVMILLLLL
jgi:hypothetical protein